MVYSVQHLRDSCPCSICREKRTALPMREVPEPDELRSLTLSGMEPVGNYAYSIAFSDGHNTGIYTFDLLRALGEQEE